MRRRTAAALSLAAALAVSACGSSASDDSDEASPQASSVQVRDPWIKAANEGMTAAFGTIHNDGKAAVKIVAASATSVAGTVELHEMAKDETGSMVMRQKEDGLTVKANGSHSLDPGGDHLMFMGITQAIKPGDEISITLKFADDSTLDFTAPARSFAGAQEEYSPDADHGGESQHGKGAQPDKHNGH